MSQGWVFWPAAIIAVASAYSMTNSKNGVHAALFLVLNLMSLAVLFVDLDASFLGVVQLIVYAGAIMVLFLFVIMLLGVDRTEDLSERIRGQQVVAMVLPIGMGITLLWVLRHAYAGVEFQGLSEANRSGNVQALGRLLFSRYLFPFEVTSVLLIVATIAAMVLGRGVTEEENASELHVHAADPRDVREMAVEAAGEER